MGRCPEHPSWPDSTCYWHTHQGEQLNLCSKDKLWEFHTTFRNPGTEIRTKGQWNRFCKEHNYVEIPHKERMEMASRGYAEKKREERVSKLKQEVKKEFLETGHREGLWDKKFVYR